MRFVVSVTMPHIRGFSYRMSRFVVSVTHIEIRGFSYQDSWYQLPRFVVLVTGQFKKTFYFQRTITFYPQLNTYITPINTTRRPATPSAETVFAFGKAFNGNRPISAHSCAGRLLIKPSVRSSSPKSRGGMGAVFSTAFFLHG